jgi:hypothetical protein
MQPLKTPHTQYARSHRTVAAGLVLLAVLIFTGPPLLNVDWGWQTRLGDRMLREARFPADDAFAWTTDGRTDHHPRFYWAIATTLSTVNRLAGVPGLVALRCLLAAALYGLLYHYLRRRGVAPLAAAALVIAIVACTRDRITLRPHLLSFSFVVITVLLLQAARLPQRRRLLLAVPPLFAVWANFHPGVILGLGALGFYVAGEGLRLVMLPWWRSRDAAAPARRPAPWRPDQWHTHDEGRFFLQLSGIVFIAAAACLITPSGTNLYRFMFAHRHMYAEQGVRELAPLSLSDPTDRHYAAAALLLLLGFFRRQTLAEPGPWCAWLFYTAMAINSHRFFPHSLHLLVLALWSLPPPPRGASFPATARLAAVVLGGLTLLPLGRYATMSRPLVHPRWNAPGAAAFLARVQTPDPLYNTGHLGGHLVYHLDGRKRVFRDGRQSLFVHLARRDWHDLYTTYNFRTAILADGEMLMAVDSAIHAPAHWRLIYFSDFARIYVDSRDPVGRAAVAAHGFEHLRFDVAQAPGAPRELYLRRLGTPAEAIAELRPLLATDPRGYYVNAALAEALLAQGDTNAALAAARTAWQQRQTSWVAALLSGAQ